MSSLGESKTKALFRYSAAVNYGYFILLRFHHKSRWGRAELETASALLTIMTPERICIPNDSHVFILTNAHAFFHLHMPIFPFNMSSAD